MSTVTKLQLTKIHMALAAIGKGDDKEYKAEQVRQFTQGRETSTTKMQWSEAEAMLLALQGISVTNWETTKRQELRGKILHYAHLMLWYADPPKMKEGRPLVDMDRLNGWCKTYSTHKKPLNDHTSTELPDLLKQYRMVYYSFLEKEKKG